MTFDEWYNENIETYNGNCTVTDYMKAAWDAALEEAIDEIRVCMPRNMLKKIKEKQTIEWSECLNCYSLHQQFFKFCPKCNQKIENYHITHQST